MLLNTIPRRRAQDAAAKGVVAVAAREAIVEERDAARAKVLHKALPKAKAAEENNAVAARREVTMPPRLNSHKHR